MASKAEGAAILPRAWCCRCHRPIHGESIEVGFKNLCIPCFWRPRVIVQIMERLRRQEREVAR